MSGPAILPSSTTTTSKERWLCAARLSSAWEVVDAIATMRSNPRRVVDARPGGRDPHEPELRCSPFCSTRQYAKCCPCRQGVAWAITPPLPQHAEVVTLTEAATHSAGWIAARRGALLRGRHLRPCRRPRLLRALRFGAVLFVLDSARFPQLLTYTSEITSSCRDTGQLASLTPTAPGAAPRAARNRTPGRIRTVRHADRPRRSPPCGTHAAHPRR